jgi:Zn-dependent M32 family carboxypeptidase
MSMKSSGGNSKPLTNNRRPRSSESQSRLDEIVISRTNSVIEALLRLTKRELSRVASADQAERGRAVSK